MFNRPRRKGRLKQLTKANRRARKHLPISEFVARLRLLEWEGRDT